MPFSDPSALEILGVLLQIRHGGSEKQLLESPCHATSTFSRYP